ncbi:MAG TPA: DMT family transporter [Candidatus Eisenbacteria bacterium]|nr:DMT family transporter [Candidatus Eisenbacteria bacterium]
MSRVMVARLEVCAAALLFSLGGAGIKATDLTSWQVAGFRSGIAALFFLLFLPESRRALTWRSLVVGSSYAATMIFFVLANKLTTSANTIFLQSAAPLYVLLLAPLLLHERARRSDIPVMLLVVIGLSLFFVGSEAPHRTAPDPVRGNLLGLAAGVTWSLTIIGMRWLGRSGNAAPLSAALTGNFLAMAISLPFALPVANAGPTDAGIILGLGVFQIGLAYVFLIRGLRDVPAFEAMVLLLLEPALNPIWSWMIHGERPGGWALVGGALILGASVLKTWNDSRVVPKPGQLAPS